MIHHPDRVSLGRAPRTSRAAPAFTAGVRRVVFAARLACAAGIGCGLFAPQAHAQAVGTATVSADVPAGPLADALNRFALQAGVAIVVDAAKVQGRTAPALTGTVTVAEGFRRLLEGSGYQAEHTPAGYVLVAQAVAMQPPSGSSSEAVLPEVRVVSAAGYEQDISHAPASISIISAAELENRPFSSLQDIVRDIPGVAVIGSGRQSGLSIRGMEKGYTLVLVDGKRVRSETGNPRELNNEDLDSNFIPPLSSIERIEVVRGPMSSLYGSDAMGGIINIITRRTPQTWSGSIGLGFRAPDSGSMGNQRQKDFHLSGPVVRDLIGLSLWGSETHQDEDRYYGGYQESTRRTLGGKLRVTPNRNHDLTFDYSRSSQHYIGSPGGSLLPTASIADREWDRDAWSAAWSAKLGPGYAGSEVLRRGLRKADLSLQRSVHDGLDEQGRRCPLRDRDR